MDLAPTEEVLAEEVPVDELPADEVEEEPDVVVDGRIGQCERLGCVGLVYRARLPVQPSRVVGAVENERRRVRSFYLGSFNAATA